MPTLQLDSSGSQQATHPLHKHITSIGSSADCDVVLSDSEVAAVHAQVHCDGSAYQITALDEKLAVNGKRRRKHDLRHGDQIALGKTTLTFRLYDPPDVAEDHPGGNDRNERHRMLLEFSGKLLTKYDLDELLEELMDAVVAVSGAAKGFLVLFEDNRPWIKVARNLRQENLGDAAEQLSDSIIAKVIRTRQPLIVSDALNDAEFANARSVMQLKVVSVMCVPLLDRDSLLGLIYVGNDNVVELFDHSSLELLTGFAAHASLIVKNALLINELRLDRQNLQQRLDAMRFGSIIGSCPAMREVFKRVEKVAATDISVLITGETGTGKELIATEIHQRSPRAKAPLVTINCGAIPENLLESELFGHVKGAFTGAVANKRGKFHAANGGTLFLDEIGELPLHLQVKLLRVLQERVVIRVGDTRPEPIDIRVIAATNRDLERAIGEGAFREDLYYRIHVINLHLPPLRERGEDVIVIARYLLSKFAEELGRKVRGFSPDATIALRKYDWRGNIRQLENHIKKAVVLADKPMLSSEDLGLTDQDLPPVLPLAQAKEDFQRRYINEVLARNNGNRTKTARDLGVDPRTIFRHLEKEDDSGSGQLP